MSKYRDVVRDFTITRMVLEVLLFVGMGIGVIGLIMALVGMSVMLEYSENPMRIFAATLPGRDAVLGGLLLIAIAQTGHAFLNMAEDTAALRALAEKQAQT